MKKPAKPVTGSQQAKEDFPLETLGFLPSASEDFANTIIINESDASTCSLSELIIQGIQQTISAEAVDVAPSSGKEAGSWQFRLPYSSSLSKVQ